MVVWYFEKDCNVCARNYQETDDISKIKKGLIHDIKDIVGKNRGKRKSVLVEKLCGTDDEGKPIFGVWLNKPVSKNLHIELLEYARSVPYNLAFPNLDLG